MDHAISESSADSPLRPVSTPPVPESQDVGLQKSSDRDQTSTGKVQEMWNFETLFPDALTEGRKEELDDEIRPIGGTMLGYMGKSRKTFNLPPGGYESRSQPLESSGLQKLGSMSMLERYLHDQDLYVTGYSGINNH